MTCKSLKIPQQRAHASTCVLYVDPTHKPTFVYNIHIVLSFTSVIATKHALTNNQLRELSVRATRAF